MSGRVKRTLTQVGNLPGLLQWRKSAFDKRFEAGQAIGCCRGVFDTYTEAAASAPSTRPLGYDTTDAAGMYRDRLNTIYPSDYPMMLWLQKAFADGVRNVFDLGGHIGLAYYAYQRMLAFPNEIRWTVHDVPSVVAAGRQEALKLDPPGRLHFADGFDGAADADMLFTAGCLQYLEETLGQRIASLAQRPRWILVNLLPLHDELAYWTVQSIGTAFCPYRIQRSPSFFADLEQLGYQVEDKWTNLDKACWVAFEPKHSLDRYYGAALKLR